VVLNHFSSILQKEKCRSAQIYSASLSTCADFISVASAGNEDEEFTRTQRVKGLPNIFFILELVNLFTISNAVLVVGVKSIAVRPN